MHIYDLKILFIHKLVMVFITNEFRLPTVKI
jgi:hypothetical protein